MSKFGVFPFHWSVEELVSHGDDVPYELAKTASSSLTPIKVLLGRCLLALAELEVHKRFGMSSVIHFAISALGHSRKEALTVRRVARELQRLPLMTKEAEQGTVSWSKLREVVSVATPETEELWLKLCQELPTGKIQKLVTLTPKGGIPGQLPSERDPHGSEYRCRFSPELVVQIERLLQQRSQVQGRPLSFADLVEQLVAEALIGKPYDEAEEKMKMEAQREFAAEQLAQDPLIRQVQDVARKLGLVKNHAEDHAEDHAESQDACGCSGCESAKSSHAGPRDQQLNSKGDLLEWALGGPAPRLSPQPLSLAGPIDSQNTTPPPAGSNSPNDFGIGYELLSRSIAKLRFNPKNRFPTEPQRNAVLRRDRYCCQTPGCHHTAFLELHHIRWYSHGGETLPHNLITLCTACHANVHAGRLFITGNLEDGLIFTDAEGRRLDRLHKLSRASWLDCWIGWRGEEWESYSSKVA